MNSNLLAIASLICLNATMVAQTPFTCTGEVYLSFYNIGAATTLNELEIAGDSTAIFSAIGAEIPYRINSIGYRVTDNLIYGIHPSNDRFYCIDATGTATELDQIDLTNNNNYVAGDVTPDGNYLVVIGKFMDQPSNELVLVDLNSPTYETTSIPLIDFTTGLSNTTVRVADIAFDPLSGVCYAYDSLNKRLVTINITTGEINSTLYESTTAAGIGAVFFDPLGQLWGYGRYLSTADLEDLIAIDLETGETTYVTSGPSSNGIDACSCPYTIDFAKIVERDTVLQCEPFHVIYPISNLTAAIQSGINFADTLPTGFIIQQVVDNPFGGTVLGIGTNQLNIDNLTLSTGIDSLIIEVQAPEELTGSFSKHAHLEGLPEYIGGAMVSDNPATILVDDPTMITLVADEDFEFCEEEISFSEEIVVPNIFSPNADGTNDVFQLFSEINLDRTDLLEIRSFLVFNRWGQKIYEGSGPNAFWDGNVNGTPAPSEVYIYHIGVEFVASGNVVELQGTVTLVR